MQKATVVLDSANRNSATTTDIFEWNITSIVPQSNFLSGRALVNKEVSNIKKIVISTIELPVSPLFNPIFNTLRCNLKFIPNPTYFGDFENNSLPFHFAFDTKYNRRCRRMILTPINDTIIFQPYISSLQNIQINFYNPYFIYDLPIDFSYVDIAEGPPEYPLYTMFTITEGFPNIPLDNGDFINIIDSIESPSDEFNSSFDSNTSLNIIKYNPNSFLIYTGVSYPTGYTQESIAIYYTSNRFFVTLDLYY